MCLIKLIIHKRNAKLHIKMMGFNSTSTTSDEDKMFYGINHLFKFLKRFQNSIIQPKLSKNRENLGLLGYTMGAFLAGQVFFAFFGPSLIEAIVGVPTEHQLRLHWKVIHEHRLHVPPKTLLDKPD